MKEPIPLPNKKHHAGDAASHHKDPSDWVEDELDHIDDDNKRVPRWPFILVILLVGTLLSVLSENLTIGPSWTILALALALTLPMLIAILKGHHQLTRILAFCLLGLCTAGLFSSVAFLIYALFTHSASAVGLFVNAFLLWIANVITFTAWYWEVDQGGPQLRHSRIPEPPDFLFPQMVSNRPVWKYWKPNFLDYLFLAFNTSTAFSPTDTLVMSRRAKLLSMTQSAVSLLVIAILAARAVNMA
jgi:hypothetical protein